MTGHIGTNTPIFVPPRWGRPRFDPTQTGLCKFGRGFGAPLDTPVFGDTLGDSLGHPKGPKIEKIQSRLNFSISLENSISIEIFNLDLQNIPQKIGPWWVADLKFSISLENFKILNFFNLWALRALRARRAQETLVAGRPGRVLWVYLPMFFVPHHPLPGAFQPDTQVRGISGHSCKHTMA